MRTKNSAVLMTNTLANMGQGLALPITTLYVHQSLHKSLTTAGLVLMVWALAMMLGNYWGGRMFDEWRQQPTYYIGGSIAIFAGLLMSLWPEWPLYAGALALYGLGLGILISAINGYLAHLQKEDKEIFNDAYWMRNVGFALSTGLSGILYAVSVRWVLILTTLLVVVALVMVKITFKEVTISPIQPAKRPQYHLFSADRQTVFSILAVCWALFITWLGYEQWGSNMSIYMIANGIPVQHYSLLFTISTGEIVLLQPLVARTFRNTYHNEKMRLIMGTVFYMASYLPIIYGNTYSFFVIGITCQTFGEMILFSTAPVFLNRFATDENRATLQSLNSMATSLASAVGPVFGGWLISLIDYQLTFVVIFALHVLVLPLLLALRAHRQVT